MQLNPREAIIEGMKESGFIVVDEKSTLHDAIKRTYHHHYILQKAEGQKGQEVLFLGDRFIFADVTEYDYLFAKRAVQALENGNFSEIDFGNEAVSSCCTSASFKCYDRIMKRAYHVTSTIGHPAKASRISNDQLGFVI